MFGVRWAGLVRASLASTYTFHTLLSGERTNHERVKLWVDGQLLIDQWTSLTALSLTSVAPTFTNRSQSTATSPQALILLALLVQKYNY